MKKQNNNVVTEIYISYGAIYSRNKIYDIVTSKGMTGVGIVDMDKGYYIVSSLKEFISANESLFDEDLKRVFENSEIILEVKQRYIVDVTLRFHEVINDQMLYLTFEEGINKKYESVIKYDENEGINCYVQ